MQNSVQIQTAKTVNIIFLQPPLGRAPQIKCALFWSCQDDWTPNDSKTFIYHL